MATRHCGVSHALDNQMMPKHRHMVLGRPQWEEVPCMGIPGIQDTRILPNPNPSTDEAALCFPDEDAVVQRSRTPSSNAAGRSVAAEVKTSQEQSPVNCGHVAPGWN